MIRRASPSPFWDDLRKALRQARADNLLRASVVELPAQHRLVMELPPRGEATAQNGLSQLVIDVGPYAATVVCHLPNGRTLKLSDLATINAFVSAMCEQARGGQPYVRSHDQRVDYKPGFRPRVP